MATEQKRLKNFSDPKTSSQTIREIIYGDMNDLENLLINLQQLSVLCSIIDFNYLDSYEISREKIKELMSLFSIFKRSFEDSINDFDSKFQSTWERLMEAVKIFEAVVV